MGSRPCTAFLLLLGLAARLAPTAAYEAVVLKRVHISDAWHEQRLHGPHSTLASLPQRLMLSEALGAKGAWAYTFAERLSDISNLQYIGNVKLGTPGTEVPVIFDTGSSDLWVNGLAASTSLVCPSGGCDQTVRIDYSVGAVEGLLRVDRLAFGGLVVENQEFVLATHLTDLDGAYFQGVLGLAFPGLSHGGTTVLSQLGSVAHADVFNFLLSDENKESTFGFGLPPRDTYRSDTSIWTPVELQEWWTFAGGLAIGSQLLCTDSMMALDTGTSFLTLPQAFFKVFLRQLLPGDLQGRCWTDARGQVTCPCEVIPQVRILYVVVGGRRFPIFPEELFVQWMDGCSLSVQTAGPNMPIILGDTFLRTIAATFDAPRLRIGMAERVGHNPSSSTEQRLRRDEARPLSDPILSPHMPRPWPLWVTFLAALVLGGSVGTLCGYLLVAVCFNEAHSNPRAAGAREACPPEKEGYIRI